MITKRYNFLVGIDSDGCVFDTMALKQKQCFHGEIVSQWGLEPIEAQVREVAEFINLHSRWRGVNRFVGLCLAFELLPKRADVVSAGVPIPDPAPLRALMDAGVPLNNTSLRAEFERTEHEFLRACLVWSEAVNRNVERVVKRAPMFEGVPEALAEMYACADLIVVSQTPTEAIAREWKENEIDQYVHWIAGQEAGAKNEHLQIGMQHGYAPDHVLMVGDAPGDLDAARKTGVHFFPILPDAEEASWQQLREEAFDRFINGAYDAAYQQGLIDAFEARLPSEPPWPVAHGQWLMVDG